MKIVIVGGGLAGLSCGEVLVGGGHDVKLFDKGRAAGGRMSTRRIGDGDDALRFDHGTPYFAAHDPKFVAQVETWQSAGIVAQWRSGADQRWVGTPAMNAPLRAMAANADIDFGARVEHLRRDNGKWFVGGDEHGAAPYDAAIIAVPAEQAGALLAPHSPMMAAKADACVSDPCWTVMAAFDAPVPVAQDEITAHGPIHRAIRDSAKPQRDGRECWVIQATAEWSRSHLEEDAGDMEQQLLSAFADAATAPLPQPIATAAHRWRYAQPAPMTDAFLWDRDLGLGVCGDWLCQGDVEGAYLSGTMLADEILS